MRSRLTAPGAGCVPYPSLSNAAVLEKVVAGMRLSRPALCPMSVYYVMEECWKDEPGQRGSFAKIHARLCALAAREGVEVPDASGDT